MKHTGAMLGLHFGQNAPTTESVFSLSGLKCRENLFRDHGLNKHYTLSCHVVFLPAENVTEVCTNRDGSRGSPHSALRITLRLYTQAA